MRWIDRGPEPPGVGGYARQFTSGWVDYYRHGSGGRPTDSYWREFRPALGNRSANICWYCERRCEPASETGGRSASVDHFRPISSFPDLVYEWANWIFSCRRCNGENKQDKWPVSGYVDPSPSDEQDRPERHFDYDVLTGEIIAHPDLAADARQKAWATITDLGLNKLDVIYYRLDWTRQFLDGLMRLPQAERLAFAQFSATRPDEFAGATAMVVAQLRATGEI